MNRYELTGWILFTASACFFIISSVRSGDVPSMIGGLLFLVACFFFLIPKRFPDRNAGR